MNDREDIKHMAALAALNDMFRKGYVCIITIDKVAKLLSVTPRSEERDILSSLHCVHFGKMPEALRASIPDLVRDCLGVETTFQFESLRSRAIAVSATPGETPTGADGAGPTVLTTDLFAGRSRD